MASKYRKIDPRVWTDEAFAELTPEQKLVALYIVTAQSNRCGLFHFSTARAAEETGIPPDSYPVAHAKVCDRLGWKFDHQRKVIYIPTWWKYNPPENPKHVQGCLQDLHDLPKTPLIQEFGVNYEYLPIHCHRAFGETMQHSYRIAMPYQEQEQEQKLEQKKTSASAEPAVAVEPPPPAKKPRAQPTGPHHELIRFFCTAWEAKHGCPYKFLDGKDGRHVRWILSAVVSDLSVAQKIVSAYLEDDDPFVADKLHPLGLLVSSFNTYRGRAFGAPRQLKGPYDKHNTRRDAASRGEYVSSLPGGSRKLGAGASPVPVEA